MFVFCFLYFKRYSYLSWKVIFNDNFLLQTVSNIKREKSIITSHVPITQEETGLSSPLDKDSIPNRELKHSKFRTQCKQSIIFQTEPRVLCTFILKKKTHTTFERVQSKMKPIYFLKLLNSNKSLTSTCSLNWTHIFIMSLWLPLSPTSLTFTLINHQSKKLTEPSITEGKLRFNA